jgi:DNA-binding NarL/FixJ family response regulator
MAPSIIRLALADDHTLFTRILSNYLSQQKNLKVILETGNASDLLLKLKETPVDVILLDLFMPKMNSIDAIKTINDDYPKIKIIVLSICTDLNIISNLLDIGIHAYLSKNEEPHKLVEAISSASQNRLYRNDLYTAALFLNKENSIKKSDFAPKTILNEREKQIIQLLWEEKSNKEISQRVFLSVRSVEKIRQDIKEKLEFKSIAGLFRYALEQGIITVPFELSKANI